MEGSRSKIEVMKPVILKAGIPLVVSVSGFIWAKIIARKRSRLCLASLQDYDSSRSKESEELVQDEEGINCSKPSLEDEVLSLRRLVESVHEKEGRLEMQFLRFCELKDRETVIMEMGKMLKMEMSRVENTSTETTLMEYAKALEEMESENQALKRKVTKLCRIVKQQSSLITENEERIAAVEDEKRVLQKIEDEIRELKRTLDESVSKTKQDEEQKCNCLQLVVAEKEDRSELGDDDCGDELCVLSPMDTSTSSSSGVGGGVCHTETKKKKKKKLLHKLQKWVEGSGNRKVKPNDDESIGEKNYKKGQRGKPVSVLRMV